MAGERIRDKIAASKKSGMWMGGLPALGYDVQNRKLVVNDEEARPYFKSREAPLHSRESLGFRVKRGKTRECAMPTEPADDGTLDELLPLAGVSPEAAAARRWLNDALIAARGTVEPQLTAIGATRAPKPSPGKHNAPLKKIERGAARLIAAFEQLRCHPYAHASFWRFKAFGPVYASGFERAGILPTLTNIREAARKAQIRRSGRPRERTGEHQSEVEMGY